MHMGDNVRIRMTNEKHYLVHNEDQPLVEHKPGGDKSSAKTRRLWIILVCTLVGAAIVGSVFIVQGMLHGLNQSDNIDVQLFSQQLQQQLDKQLDQNKVATNLQYRLDYVKKLLDKVPLIDGHNDLAMVIRSKVDTELSKVNLSSDLSKLWPGSHTDIPRIKKGKLGGQFWSVYVSCNTQYKDAVQHGIEQIDLIKSMILQYPDVFQLVTSSKDIISTHSNGKFVSMMGMEGGHMIGESMAILRQVYELGVRYLTLTHTCNTPWADSCNEDSKTPKNNGLTKWGKLLVSEMNRLGMLVDISHVSPKVMSDVLDTSIAPVIFSHSSAKALCPNPRNVPDSILHRMKSNGGIVMVNFNPPFVNCTEQNTDNKIASLEQVADHVDYIRDVTGEDHVGIGADYDGISSTPAGLEDVSRYPYLFAELLRRGWTGRQLAKLAGYNIIRVFEDVEKVKFTMQDLLPQDKPIDYSRIPPNDCRTSTQVYKYPS